MDLQERSVHVDRPSIHVDRPLLHVDQPPLQVEEPLLQAKESSLHLEEPFLQLQEPSLHLHQPSLVEPEPNAKASGKVLVRVGSAGVWGKAHNPGPRVSCRLPGGARPPFALHPPQRRSSQHPGASRSNG
ncbi:hypothetical protein AY599_15810 [Leptolyngbya valderiana BDU 20041]|nr:hypothetical protein AY599_15810 [Leptolyngbya valderiana BDU 20041]